MHTVASYAYAIAARNQRVAETQVTFDHDLTLRLIVWKQLGQQVVRDAQGKTERDAAGRPARVACRSATPM